MTTTPFKPEGYSSVSPYLIVADAQRVIDFLVATFGATTLRRFDRPDGSLGHAEVRIDDTVVMLGEAGGDWPSVPAHIHVYVTDVDAVFDRAVAAGGEVVRRPESKGDPDKRGGIKDASGNTWWISTQQA